ncbi:MAG TPA: carbonic anhydrase [Bacteroidales bacterium]|nr:carbonic anhydrase [Bacteroidales bacterium]
MNYKKIFKSQKVRFIILKLFDFVPDKLMIVIQYKLSTGRWLKLKKPIRFTEKIQWYKLNYRHDILTKCSDKYSVREYVTAKGLSNILIPNYGVYNNVKEINFENLPDKFVLKTTNGSHTNILCADKSKLNSELAKKTIKGWLYSWTSKMGREWGYYNIKPRIICEKLLEKDSNNDLIDYKFFCFNGKPFCLYVIVDRFLEDGIKLGIFDTEFNLMPYRRSDIRGITTNIPKPNNFNRMLEIAKVLSKDFPFVRVDLYNIEGSIYFGELTFYDGSGYKGYLPDEFDFILGEKFTLPIIQTEN